MQCTSYTPVYYHARDLNVGGSGYAWHLYDSNASFGEERSYNVSMPLCDQYLGYDKEVLKQIIQNHEATFRFQVQELHRLYRRQRDLMDEMRVRELFGQHLLSRTSESIHSSSRDGDGFSQKPSSSTNWFLGNLSFSKLSEPTNVLGPKSSAAENFQKPTTPQNDFFIKGRNSEYDAQFLSPSSKQNGIRVFDLEFSADTYYEDQVKTCCTPENISKFKPASPSDISSNKTWELSSITSDLRKANCFIDLNEPVQLESLSGPLEAVTGHSETVCNEEGVPVEATPESRAPRHDLKSGESSDGINSSMAIDLNSMPVNCYSETEMTIESTPANTEAEVVLDCFSASNHAVRNRKCSEEEKVIVHNNISDSSMKTESFIDLNTSVEDEHSLTPSSSSLQIKSAEFTELKGPLSPENEEHSPPREKSQLETPLSSEQGEGEPFIELETTAAQTLVTIFSSRVHECSGVAVLESLANFRNLCWFAEIVSSTGDEQENAVMKLDSDSAENDQGEDITLNSIHLNKGKGTGNMRRRSGKGQKRGKKQCKELKTDVSEDVHLVEGFLEKGPLKRKAGRNGCAKPRKCSKLSPSDVTKKSMSSILKQSAGSSEQGAVQNWGKTQKREGCRRCSSTIKFFLIR